MGRTVTIAIKVMSGKADSLDGVTVAGREILSSLRQYPLGSFLGAEDNRRCNDVYDQRDEEQHHANKEQNMIMRASICNFTHFCGNGGGHRADRGEETAKF